MWRYFFSFLILSFCFCSFGIADEITIFKTDKDKNLIVQETPAEKTLNEEVSQEYKPVEYKWAFLKMLFWLAVLIFFFILTFYMLKKMSHSRITAANQNKKIKILEKRALSPKTAIYLVEYENKKILIGESQNELKMHNIDHSNT